MLYGTTSCFGFVIWYICNIAVPWREIFNGQLVILIKNPNSKPSLHILISPFFLFLFWLLEFIRIANRNASPTIKITCFWTDGIPICGKSCILCSMGCSYLIVYGVAGFLYPEMAYCWRSWDCLVDSCRSWGTTLVIFFI